MSLTRIKSSSTSFFSILCKIHFIFVKMLRPNFYRHKFLRTIEAEILTQGKNAWPMPKTKKRTKNNITKEARECLTEAL